jgi:hypothetical protein
LRNEPPERRLQRLLKGSSRYAQTIDVDRAIDKSRLGAHGGKLRIPAGVRPIRHPGGSKAARAGAGSTFKYRWNGAGVVAKHWSYRRSIGHLGEDKAARGDKEPGFTVSDYKKDTLASPRGKRQRALDPEQDRCRPSGRRTSNGTIVASAI